MSFFRKYNAAGKVRIPLMKAGTTNHAVGADWTPVAGDVKVIKDGGAAANIGTLPTAIAAGNSAVWEFVFTGTELSAAEVNVIIADSVTKAVEDDGFTIETYGNASAQFVADFSVAAMAALQPTTAGRTLDVTATGEAGIDWANIGAPTTTVNLSGTTIKTATDVTALLPSSLTVDGNIKADALKVGGNAPENATVIAAATWDMDATAHQTLGTFGKAIGDPVAGTDTIYGRITSFLDAAVSAVPNVTEVKDSCKIAIDDKLTTIATTIWTYVIKGSHTGEMIMRALRAFLYGRVTGAATSAPTYYDPESGTAVITGSAVDAPGNRNASTTVLT